MFFYEMNLGVLVHRLTSAMAYQQVDAQLCAGIGDTDCTGANACAGVKIAKGLVQHLAQPLAQRLAQGPAQRLAPGLVQGLAVKGWRARACAVVGAVACAGAGALIGAAVAKGPKQGLAQGFARALWQELAQRLAQKLEEAIAHGPTQKLRTSWRRVLRKINSEGCFRSLCKGSGHALRKGLRKGWAWRKKLALGLRKTPRKTFPDRLAQGLQQGLVRGEGRGARVRARAGTKTCARDCACTGAGGCAKVGAWAGALAVSIPSRSAGPLI